MVDSWLVVHWFVWRDSRRNQDHAREPELKVSFLRTDEMAKVGRVERPAEDSNAHVG